MAEFTHLHCHSDYSLLDGACRIRDLAQVTDQMGMEAIAITDHGSMAGAFDFYQTMSKNGIKPIIGCEFYLAPGSRFEQNPNHPNCRGFHQLALAKDNEGYRNMCRLNGIAHLEGFYHKPRIDRESFSQNHKGLVATTSCIGGEVPQAILAGNEKEAQQILDDYLQIFGREDYYIELQDHGFREQQVVNKALLKFAADMNVKLLATNDAHYLTRDHALPHEVLLCIGTQKTMKDANRMRFSGGPEYYVKSPEEMSELFKDFPDALRNTMEVAEKCHVTLETGVNHYPVYDPPDGSDRKDYLRLQCKLGLIDRYDIDLDARGYEGLNADEKAVIDRMEHELGIIDRMGFISYFLVVWDFLDYARKEGIPVGPGRGSGAGSIVAYLTYITDIEPLRYNLLFERFLNPDRVSPPDFDIDLCERRRVEVIEYVRDKYGAENVAQIGTFGTLKAKAVLKDVARALGRPFEDGNRLSKTIPADPKMTLAKALDESSELAQMREHEDWVQEIFKYSEPLEGLVRNTSIHAAGVIIGDQPLTNLVPLGRGQGNEAITQYPGVPCEELGLLKMDFLGLRTLTIVSDACAIAKKALDVDLEPSSFPIDDKKAYELLNQGRTVAVFQLESGGMQDLCRKFGVDRLEDIIALIALYRPGPMQFIDEFISRKMGHTRVEYDHPDMEPILSETYGIMLYQEQVMQVVQKLALFTLAEADLLRRAMGKKKVEVMAAQLEKFVKGCADNNIAADRAKRIFDKIEMFAGYGFNKSHSAAYGLIAYQTAFLKANYPVAFLAANLSSEMSSADRVTILINEANDMGIQVLPPDVNRSDLDFTVDDGAIRFGLAAIKGVGHAASEAIISAREEAGDFETMLNLCERTGSSLNRRVMENLCRCGAFDCFGLRRSQMMLMIDDTLARANAASRDRELGQATFFDLLAGGEEADGSGDELEVPDVPEWEEADILKTEKELLGFYVTGHPLGQYTPLIKAYSSTTILGLKEAEDNDGVRIGGLINLVEPKISKKDGTPWAVLQLEGLDGTIEALCFSKTYAECSSHVVGGNVVVVEAFVSKRDPEESAKLIISKIMPIDEAPLSYTEELHLRVREDGCEHAALQAVHGLLESNPGQTPVIVSASCRDGNIAFVELSKGLQLSMSCYRELRTILGDDGLHIRANRELPERRRRRAPAA